MIVSHKKTDDGRLFVSIYDDNLKGKTFEEDGRFLDLSVKYYEGSHLPLAETQRLCRLAYMISFFGDESIAFAIKEDLIYTENIISIQGIKTAQAMLVQ